MVTFNPKTTQSDIKLTINKRGSQIDSHIDFLPIFGWGFKDREEQGFCKFRGFQYCVFTRLDYSVNIRIRLREKNKSK